MMTSFTRIVVVLSLLRTALGTATSPPNSVVISLALFLTAFVVGPVLTRVYDVGIKPLVANEISVNEASDRASGPCRRSSAALQANLLRAGRRLDAGRRLADPELRDLAGEPLPWRRAPIAARRDLFRKFATPAPGTPGNFRRYPADIRIGDRYGIRTWSIALAAGDTAANHHSVGDFLAPLRARTRKSDVRTWKSENWKSEFGSCVIPGF